MPINTGCIYRKIMNPKSDQRIDDQERYLVVPRTLVFLFDEQDRVLLLKGAENKIRWAGLYNGIGGHVERGKISLMQPIGNYRKRRAFLMLICIFVVRLPLTCQNKLV